MKLIYGGPHPTVYLTDDESVGNETGEDGAPVIRRGVPVEVPDELAVRLLEQSTWGVAKRAPSNKPAVQTPAGNTTREQ